MILCDTGPLVALLDADDVHHARCMTALSSLSGPLITTWPCLTEAMHFLGKARGWQAQSALWQFVWRDVLQVQSADEKQMRRIAELMAQYRDTPMDLADASLVAAAETLGATKIFTLDSDFFVYRLGNGAALAIVP